MDLTIVWDPVTRVPKIPGSSLAGVYRSYAAMAWQENGPNRRSKPYYPDCAGQGQPDKTGKNGHCGQSCMVFGFARGAGGGFAGLAAFSDAGVLLFPVATCEGPMWVTCPDALRMIGQEIKSPLEDCVYQQNSGKGSSKPLNLGWLLLDRKHTLPDGNTWPTLNKNIPNYIAQHLVIVPDKLFTHIVNSNLEVRTSVSINPETGAAEKGALFSYEALPRATVLVWRVVCKNPQHFQVGGQSVQAVTTSNGVFDVVGRAHPYLECLGIGGMGTRGVGRIRVIHPVVEGSECGHPAEAQPSEGGE